MHADYSHSIVGCRKRLVKRRLKWSCPIRKDSRESRSFSACSVAFSSRPSATWKTTSTPCTRAFTFTSSCRSWNPLWLFKNYSNSTNASGATCANTVSTPREPCAYTSCEITGTTRRSIAARSATSPSCCPSSLGSTCKSDITCRPRRLPGRASSLRPSLRSGNDLLPPRLREAPPTRGERSTRPQTSLRNRNRLRTSSGWRSSQENFRNPPVPRRFRLPARPVIWFATASRAKASDLIFSIGSKVVCLLYRIDDCKYCGVDGLIEYERVEVATRARIRQPRRKWTRFKTSGERRLVRVRRKFGFCFCIRHCIFPLVSCSAIVRF